MPVKNVLRKEYAQSASLKSTISTKHPISVPFASWLSTNASCARAKAYVKDVNSNISWRVELSVPNVLL